LRKHLKSNRALRLVASPVPRFQELAAKEKALLIVSNKTKWNNFKRELIDSKMVTNYGMQQFILMEMLERTADDMEGEKRTKPMENTLNHQRQTKKPIDGWRMDYKNTEAKSFFDKMRTAPSATTSAPHLPFSVCSQRKHEPTTRVALTAQGA